MIALIIILLVVALFIFLYKKGIFNSDSDNVDVSQKYNSDAGNFVVSGKKQKFVITKDEKIAFLVEDGQIVACKDKRISNDFVYYGDK